MKKSIDKTIIELFCNIQSKENLYSENKTLFYLYAAFTVFFGVIVSLLEYFKDNDITLLVAPILFVVLVIVFAIWNFRAKQNASYEKHFIFQGAVTLAISLIWLHLAFQTVFVKHLGFSIIYLCGVALGFVISALLLVLRIRKWNRLIVSYEKTANNGFNNKAVSLGITVILLLSLLLKSLDKILVYKLLVAGLFVLFFIFITIAINLFVNARIIKKYY